MLDRGLAIGSGHVYRGLAIGIEDFLDTGLAR